MINITNNLESKEIDNILINDYGYTEEILIQMAANNLFNVIDKTKQKYLILVGPGNNGADGLALAILLHSIGKKVYIWCLKNQSIYYTICKNLKLEFIDEIKNIDIVIDALFGIGVQGKISDEYQNIIDIINSNKENGYKIISIDMVSSNLQADLVYMLSSYKEALLYSNLEVKLCKIGVNPSIYSKSSNKFLIDKEDIKKIKKEKNIFSNKSDFGRVKIYAKKGAALLATLASKKCGAGYTYLVSDEITKNANLIANPECINSDCDKGIDAVVIGPNNGVDFDYKSIILANLDKNIVIDADALTYLSINKEVLNILNEKCVLTPHPLEFARLCGGSLDKILDDPFKMLEKFYNKTKFKGTIVYKSKNNIITDGNKFYVVNIGNSKMANAGMGDLLTGMIASYLAQGYECVNACIYATYKQAETAMKLNYKDVINPTDIIKEI